MKRLSTINCSLLTIIYSLFTIHCFSQNKTIDSLQQALKDFDAKKLELRKNHLADESDTTRVNILNGLSWEFVLVGEYDQAKKYADEALSIGQQIGFKRAVAFSYNNLGAVYYSQGNYPVALTNYFASLKIMEEIGDKKRIAFCYNNIGLIYSEQGNYPEGLKNYFAALKIFDDMGDKNSIAGSYGNIGLIYSEQENYPEALKNYLASLKIYQETGDKRGIAAAYNNIGNFYFSQGNNAEALKNYLIALKIFDEIGDVNSLAGSYGNLGNIYEAQGNYPEALKNYFASLKIFDEIGDKNNSATSYINIGNTKLKSQSATEGKDWLIKGVQLAKEIEAISVMKDGYEGLAKADSALGNFKGAYENHKLFVLYSDSVHNEEATQKLLQTNMQYEFDKKEAATKAVTDAELKKQKLLRNGFVGGFAVVLLFAGVFFRQRNKIKKEKLRAETALDELKNAQQKLVEKERLAAIGTVAQRMAHEIQNPLNFVNNFSELSEGLTDELAKAKTEEEKQEIISTMKENMSKINHHGKRADGIIKKLQRHLNEGKGLDLFEN